MDRPVLAKTSPCAQPNCLTRSIATPLIPAAPLLRRTLPRLGPLGPKQAGSGLMPAQPLLRPAKLHKVAAVTDMSVPDSLASIDASEFLQILFDNTSDDECTIITVEGQDKAHLLMSLTGAFDTLSLDVVSASIQNEDGRVLDVFRVQTKDGKKVDSQDFDRVRSQLWQFASSTSRSSRPAIYGLVATAEVERLKPLSGTSASSDVATLELCAAELAQAAAELVAKEREILKMRERGADSKALAPKETARAEAAAVLERKMAAMEAVLVTRRTQTTVEQPKTVSALMEQLKPPVAARATGSGPACGNGYEILLQAFNWESHKGGKYYKTLTNQVKDIANAGFTSVWLPPPSDSVSPQGYLPRDLYNLNSCYGTEAELRDCISVFHEHGLKVNADIVVNHRCATYQGPDGKWNKFGGRLAWDASAICSNNPAFGGRGQAKQGDDYAAAPNIDHTQERIRQDIIEWLKWLRNSIGFDGWRLDFVRGYPGNYAKIYIDATVPEMAFGEYWDTCEYTDGVLNYNQDAHRQRTVNWVDGSGGTAGAFDFTTKGILQEAVGRREYWRLVDAQGRPPGLMGMWPSRAVTFIDNHDTGSTLNHWPFPGNHLPEGYAYLLTHCGTPCVFWDHLLTEHNGLRKAILELIQVRKRHGLNARSKVTVKKTANDLYAAVIDDKIAMKIGPGDWSPNRAGITLQGKEAKLACSGYNFAVWEPKD